MSGQASVEAVALLPVLAVVVAAVLAVFAAGAASEAADAAAHAGAVALVQGRDAEAAAREALEGWSRRAATVDVAGSRVTVVVRPPVPVPFLARALEARTIAASGLRPRPSASAAPEQRGGDGRGAKPGRR